MAQNKDPTYADIRDITPMKRDWIVIVRLVHCYHMPVRGNPDAILTIECLFEDIEGDRIHCTIEGSLLQHLNCSPIEGHIYAIKDFLVVEDTSPFKTSTNRNKILFHENTELVEISTEEPVSRIRQDERLFRPSLVNQIDRLRDWLAIACNQCVQWSNTYGVFISCNKCASPNSDAQFRPKLGLILTDHTGTKRLTFWDKEAVRLIGY